LPIITTSRNDDAGEQAANGDELAYVHGAGQRLGNGVVEHEAQHRQRHQPAATHRTCRHRRRTAGLWFGVHGEIFPLQGWSTH
jgi:hypothetical protein